MKDIIFTWFIVSRQALHPIDGARPSPLASSTHSLISVSSRHPQPVQRSSLRHRAQGSWKSKVHQVYVVHNRLVCCGLKFAAEFSSVFDYILQISVFLLIIAP